MKEFPQQMMVKEIEMVIGEYKWMNQSIDTWQCACSIEVDEVKHSYN